MRPKTTPDAFIKRWKTTIGGPNGAMPRSRLVVHAPARWALAPNGTLQGRTYELKVQRGMQKTAAAMLAESIDAIAEALDLDRSQLHVDELPHGNSQRRALLTVVETGVWRPDALLTEQGPQVENGLITGLCRDHNDTPKPVQMWDDAGMVETVLLGRDPASCTLAGWQLATVALSAGIANLILVDPKAKSPAALRQAARVVITDYTYAWQADTIVRALIGGRALYAAANGLDQLNPGVPGSELPPWMVLYDDVELIHVVHDWERVWCANFQTYRRLGLWPVAVARSSAHHSWANVDTQGAFGQALRVPEPDHAGAAPSEQPSARDVADVEARLERFARVPELHAVDVETLTNLLGEPVDGRWTIGPLGTHNVPSYRVPISSDGWHLLHDEFSTSETRGTGAGKNPTPIPLDALLLAGRTPTVSAQRPIPLAQRLDTMSAHSGTTPTSPAPEPTPAPTDASDPTVTDDDQDQDQD